MKINSLYAIGGIAAGGIATLALAFGPIDRAQAATIASLYNTGVSDTSVVLGDNVADSHYSIVSSPGGANNGSPVARSTGYPLAGEIGAGTWAPAGGPSAWIGPNATNFYGLSGTYVYETSFDLTGLNPSTAVIEGRWASDNTASMFLNGSALGINRTNPADATFIDSNFSIANTNLLAGINTLRFVVQNGPVNVDANNPTGLRVEFSTRTADSSSTAVPEPSDLIGTAIAFGSVVILKRNLSKKNIKREGISK
jgi:hypothetical protein